MTQEIKVVASQELPTRGELAFHNHKLKETLDDVMAKQVKMARIVDITRVIVDVLRHDSRYRNFPLLEKVEEILKEL